MKTTRDCVGDFLLRFVSRLSDLVFQFTPSLLLSSPTLLGGEL